MIKKLVTPRNEKKVYFLFYRDMSLYYVTDPSDDFPEGLEFPVPISDIGNATFLATDKACLFMRYIREHLESVKKARLAGLSPDKVKLLIVKLKENPTTILDFDHSILTKELEEYDYIRDNGHEGHKLTAFGCMIREKIVKGTLDKDEETQLSLMGGNS